MSPQRFVEWFNKLKIAWETKNPQDAADLCAEKVLYYETPFGVPLKTKWEVLKEWQTVPSSQKDIVFSFEILNVDKSAGIAHWSVEFTRIPSGKKTFLDGIFKVILNDDNLATEFRQWWVTKE